MWVETPSLGLQMLLWNVCGSRRRERLTRGWEPELQSRGNTVAPYFDAPPPNLTLGSSLPYQAQDISFSVFSGLSSNSPEVPQSTDLFKTTVSVENISVLHPISLKWHFQVFHKYSSSRCCMKKDPQTLPFFIVTVKNLLVVPCWRNFVLGSWLWIINLIDACMVGLMIMKGRLTFWY